MVTFTQNFLAVYLLSMLICTTLATFPIHNALALGSISPRAFRPAPAPQVDSSRPALAPKTAFPRAFGPVPAPGADTSRPALAPIAASPREFGAAPAPEIDSSRVALAPGATSPGLFDVTNYGAIADGKTENHLAFSAAWSVACKYAGNSATFLIPEGTFLVDPIEFSGPCYNNKSPNIEIRGTLIAPTRLDAFTDNFWIMFQLLNQFNLTGAGTGVLDGQGEHSWAHAGCSTREKCQNNPCSVRFNQISGGTISEIALLNSKGFHISFLYTENVLVHDITITAPGNSPNTDGIHIGDSTNINITSSKIGVGDDCVSIGPGTTNITISNVNCGPGHGISVGSLGKYQNEKDVVGVIVKNCTFNGTDNGVRIKTWADALSANKAANLTFEDIKMINVSNPIIIDQEYCPGHYCSSNKPSVVMISDVNFKNISGTSNTQSAVTLLCSSGVPCKNVGLKDINLTNINGDGPTKSECLNVNGTSSGVKNPIPCF